MRKAALIAAALCLLGGILLVAELRTDNDAMVSPAGPVLGSPQRSAPLLQGRAAEAGLPQREPDEAARAASAEPGSKPGFVRVEMDPSGLGGSGLNRNPGDVYLLPKNLPGLDEDWIEKLDYVGGWAYRGEASKLAGHWIGALVWGMLPVFFDGDHWQGGVIRLKLRRAPLTEIRVRTHAEGPMPDCGIQVWSVAPRGGAQFRWPGPDADTAIHQSNVRVPENGCYRAYFGTRAPLQARFFAKGYYAEPALLAIPPGRGTFDVVLHRSAQLLVRPRGLPESGYFLMSVYDAATGEEIEYDLAGAHGPQGPEGSPYQQHVRSNLRPGSYRVEVEADLYETSSTLVEIRTRGEQVRIEPEMRELPDLGTLTVQAELRPGLAVEDPKHVGLLRIKLRRAGDAGRGWHEPDWFEEDWRKAQVHVAKLPAGCYDMLVWETQERRYVGLLRDVIVRPGETTRAPVLLRRGRWFPLKALGEAGWIDDTLRLRTDELGEVPAVIGTVFDLSMLARLGGPDKSSLGPYPFDELEAEHGPEDARRRMQLASDK